MSRPRSSRPVISPSGLALALALAVVISPGATRAQEDGATPPSSWSGERFHNARPKPLPEMRRELPPGLGRLENFAPGQAAPARAPTVAPGDALEERLYTPDADREPPADEAEDEDDITLNPQAVGRSGASFTQSRVFPDRALTAFPYRTIGKLFFRFPALDADFTCTGFVIERRVVATAGHCVFDFVRGVGSSARDFVFIPAFDRGRAPFGRWRGTWSRPAPSWRQGDGTVPSPADFGVITVADREIRGRRVALGDVVGVLGWQIQVDVNQVALLGYPGNLDRGERMQQTHAGLFEVIPPNAIEFGSAQGEGASGGPIVEDFGNPASGQPQTANRVVSIVSFGTDFDGTLGGSILSQEFADLVDMACRRRRGNCVD